MDDRAHGDGALATPQSRLMAGDAEVVPVWGYPAIEADREAAAVRELGTCFVEKGAQPFEMVREPHVIVGKVRDVAPARLPQHDVPIRVADSRRFGEVEPPD